jgi:PST family polysaccharide transporter
MFDMIKKLLLKKSVQNGAWMYALQFFNMVVPLLTLPYITRVLGSSMYGTFSTALNIVSYLQVVVEYGFIMSATRKVAINGKRDLNKTFTTVVLGRVLLLGICALISLCYVILHIKNKSLCCSFLILLICLLGVCVQMNWLFQGLQEMKYISIVNVVARSISTALTFIFVKSASDLYLYCLLYSVSPFLSGFIGLFLARKKYALQFVKIGLHDILGELKDGFYVFTTQLSAKVFGAIGITFLSIFASSSVVGIYSAIQKIPNVMILLWTPIDQVIYPITSKHYKNGFCEGQNFVKSARKKILPVFIAMALAIGVISKPTVQLLYGSEYSPYFYWLLPLLVWLIISIDNNFWGVQNLLGSGHDKEYGEAFQIGVVATIALNFIFIWLWGGMGAAVAPLISELFLNVLLRWKTAGIVKKERVDIG